MTEEELKQAARELGMDLEEVKEMYRRAIGSDLFSETKEKGGLDKLFKDLKTRSGGKDQETMGERAMKRKKGDASKEDTVYKHLQQVAALLNLEPAHREMALKSMSEAEQEELMVSMKAMSSMLGGQKLKSATEPTLEPWSLNDLGYMVHKGGPQQKKMVGIYDAFTSSQLNRSKKVELTTKEGEERETVMAVAYKAFTSNVLNDEQKDNRSKTGRAAYDVFTSRNLNR